jgi:hypothetical protein
MLEPEKRSFYRRKGEEESLQPVATQGQRTSLVYLVVVTILLPDSSSPLLLFFC